MKPQLLKVLLGVVVVAIIAAVMVGGCSRPPKPIVKVDDKKNPDGDDSLFRTFADNIRYPENPRAIDDWTRVRNELGPLAGHFSQAEVLARLRLSSEDREFLQKEAHLSDAELAEVESPSIRTADAHYIDECLLLRAAARSCEVGRLNPVEQTEHSFRWVMHNVLLHEQVDTWIPPAFTLRRGHGGAVDRALVFLALLRQAAFTRQTRADGCLLVVPGPEPMPFLIAVYDTNDKTTRLFDPRLETAVRTKDGKSIATLQDVQADPTLLGPSGFAPEQVKQLEARLVLPLYSLSPRMRELQAQLRRYEPISLARTDELPAQDGKPITFKSIKSLRDELAAIAKLPVKVWNEKAEGKTPPSSPTRAMSLFLSKQDGGVDETNRAALVARARLPFENTLANYANIGITQDALPTTTSWRMLLGYTEGLLRNYDLHTRELYLRGMHEALNTRQERVRGFARDDALLGLTHKEFLEWVVKLRKDNTDLGDAKGELMLQAMWAQDELLDYLFDVERAIKLDPKTGKPVSKLKATVPARIVAVGIHDYLQNELARSQAAFLQEKAEKLQAELRAAEKPTPAARTRAEDAWSDAKTAWGNFYAGRIVLEPMIADRIARLREQARMREPELTVHRIHLLETLHLDVQKYFQARLRCAECMLHADSNDGPKNARAYLEQTKREIDDLQRKGVLKAEIERLAGALPQALRPPFQKRLDLLADDWAERGNYYWLRQRIDARLKSL